VAYVCRFDPAGGRKQFAPLIWTPAAGWQWKAPPEPRPLYHLDTLAARPAAPVLVCEGEKSADAAARLCPDWVAITTMNGAQSAAKSDFGPLAGRRVLIWPDADKPGADYAATVTTKARDAGAVSVEVLDLAALAVDPTTGAPRELPKGWDAADAKTDGWTAEALAAAVRWRPGGIDDPEPTGATDQPRDPPAPADATDPDGADLPHSFVRRPAGIYYVRPGGSKGAKGGGDEAPPLFVCADLRITATTRDSAGDNFGRLVEFKDPDGRPRRVAIAARDWQGSGDTLRQSMAYMGLRISTHPEARRLFLDLLDRSQPPTRARAVSKTGWTADGVYLLPDQAFGESAEPCILAAEGERPAFGTRGTLDAWQGTVGVWCKGNSRLLFVVSVAFAAPLLHLINMQSGGFHYRGDSMNASSTGKTTSLRVGASVCGSPEYVECCRATDNGNEVMAELHNDAFLPMDEMGQAEAKTVGDTIYLFCNGRSKFRMDRGTGGRPVKTFRLLFLSSGEIGLREHMATAGKRATAGQEVRLCEISADAGAGHGIFEDLHGHADGAAFALALTDAAAANYGHPFIAFLEAVIRERATLPAQIKRLQDAFVAEVLTGIDKPSGQVRRAAARFGLVAVAGELAALWRITPWDTGEAKAAAARCFHDWLGMRGGGGAAEERDLIAQVKYFFEKNHNRFRWKSRVDDDHSPEVALQAGFKDKPDDQGGAFVYYAYPETFRREIVVGFNPAEAARVLIAHGMLRPDKEGKSTRNVRLPGFARPVRVFVFNADLGADDES
jgi:uncharacterized protein (DUF927 family)